MLVESQNKNEIVVALPSSKLFVVRETMSADLITPIGVYLKVRDQYPGAILLESADNQYGKNAKSFIAIDPVATIVALREFCTVEIRSNRFTAKISNEDCNPFELLNQFQRSFSFLNNDNSGSGLMGYIGYDAVTFSVDVLASTSSDQNEIPLFQFSLFRYVLEFDHLTHELHIVQCVPEGQGSMKLPKSIFAGEGNLAYPFLLKGEEQAFTSDEKFLENVRVGKEHCKLGDVFQVVLSRKFSQGFSGDDFNVYRALRMINPSPYLFYADFKSFRLFGSSPEAQFVSKDGYAELHPIAGTYRKTGDETVDADKALELSKDKKETAEHIMLVDLARNDLSRFCNAVEVSEYMQVHNYSHVMHLVSKVRGKIREGVSAIDQIRYSFPAGTLSGAPKIRAMEIIEKSETVARGWYGGCIGVLGFDGSVNMAILIRTFMSKNGQLQYQAGAGVVIDSDPKMELHQIQHKLGALRQALQKATTL